MFTGIIETVAKVVSLENEQSNLHITLESHLAPEFKVDQSVSHNGVCLTVVNINGLQYTVTAVDETLQVTNLGNLKLGSIINIERCMLMNGRLDGHIVQGHVDAVCKCLIKDENRGSWRFVFSYEPSPMNIIVEKGSICINGISLTAFHVTDTTFEVAIIPYTYEHTNLHQVEVGDSINLEFDIIGKYIARLQDFKKMKRCAWLTNNDIYIRYHDEEWGVPVYDDFILFEMLNLEGAQAGLSWLTVLLKRDNYRQLFANFNPNIIQEFSDEYLDEVLLNPGIIRNRLKVYGVRKNAVAFIQVVKEWGSFSNYIWHFVNGKPIVNQYNTLKEIPVQESISEKMSKDLKKRGFTFVGPTICYAFMQAVGMVNDHTTDCFRHQSLV